MIGTPSGAFHDAELNRAEVGAAYDAAAPAWVAGPERAYRRMAEALVAGSPVPVAGLRVLDLGAGTGVVSRAARAAGADRVVAVDISPGMLVRVRSAMPVVADATRLPFSAGSFDVVFSGCCLSHLPDPVAALREARRVAPVIVASAFEPGWAHPAKAAVDAVAVRYGFSVPSWYLTLKVSVEPLVDDPRSLAGLATAAGYRSARTRVVPVETGLATPAELVSWRFGMAHLAPFVAGLPPDRRVRLRRDAETAVAGTPPLVIALVVLTALA